MQYSKAHIRRKNNVMKWFAPARFGLFYHWGLFTGGSGMTHKNPEQDTPLAYRTPEEFEAAAGDPEEVARNMVRTARSCGAGYITFTMVHTNEANCVLFPTENPGYRYKTSRDYVCAVIREARRNGIRTLIYLPASADHWESGSMGPCVSEDLRTPDGYFKSICALAKEIYERSEGQAAGFWLDGMNPAMTAFPAFLRSLSEDLIIINNNNTSLDIDDADYGTTEFLCPDLQPDPPYNRSSALRQKASFSISIPGRDFNEDIPTSCCWWDHGDHHSMKCAKPYLEDPHFLLKQMLSCLGQNGQWNFTFGIGPRTDGTLPPEFQPMFDVLHEFMQWGSESVKNTTGGLDSQIMPGWFTAPWSPQGFCSVTRKLDDPAVHYVHVTTAPDCPKALFRSNGLEPQSITDLRTGEAVPFRMAAGILIENIDWTDVDRYGVKTFKVIF